jgi:hypothetical protein
MIEVSGSGSVSLTNGSGTGSATLLLTVSHWIVSSVIPLNLVPIDRYPVPVPHLSLIHCFSHI